MHELMFMVAEFRLKIMNVLCEIDLQLRTALKSWWYDIRRV